MSLTDAMSAIYNWLRFTGAQLQPMVTGQEINAAQFEVNITQFAPVQCQRHFLVLAEDTPRCWRVVEEL